MKRIRKTKRWLAVVALAGAPMVTTASCNPYYGTFDFFRDDDAYYDDGGFFDIFIEDDYYDDCFDCFYEEDVIFLDF